MLHLDMYHLLVLLLLCSSGLQAEGEHTSRESFRLVGRPSRCAGTLKVKENGEWRPVYGVFYSDWNLKTAAAACRELDCGSAVSVEEREESSVRSVLWIRSDCVESGSTLRKCVVSGPPYSILDITCSDLLLQPNISVSSSMDGVSEAQQQGFQVFRGSTFNISCSIQPQYPGGSFQLTFTSSNSTHNSTHPAVNHSAHFLFPAAEPAHQGNYSCVYQLYIFSHNFSSESHLLSLTVSGKRTVYRFGKDDWSKLSRNDQLITCCFWTEAVTCYIAYSNQTYTKCLMARANNKVK
uniref:SRCR domain-containing protein n=1 Tax=Sander lucioperca TaxID=283035 RepID=A0A8C9XFX2_SANLU